MSTRQLIETYCDLSWNIKDLAKVAAGITVGLILFFVYFTAAEYYAAWAEWSLI